MDWVMSLIPGFTQSTLSLTVLPLKTVQGGPCLPSHLKSWLAGKVDLLLQPRMSALWTTPAPALHSSQHIFPSQPPSHHTLSTSRNTFFVILLQQLWSLCSWDLV